MAVERGTPGKSLIKGALVSALGVLVGEETTRDVKAKIKGFRGESQVGRALRGMPEAWRVFHDVDLGGENIDHVVAGPRGVFNIEVKNYVGAVVANARGLHTHGRRNNGPVEQAMRQAHELGEHLGVEIQPVLAFVGSDLTGHEVDGLPVVMLSELTDFLLFDDGRRLAWHEAKQVFDTLGSLTR